MYDAIVIGSGPGGYVAAIRLSQLGQSVAIIEKAHVGGTCTNVGCIPTKALLQATHLYADIENKAARYGIKVSEYEYDLAGIMKNMNSVISGTRRNIQSLLKKNEIAYHQGTAVVVDPRTVRIEETGETLECQNLVLAHGSVPVTFPPFAQVEGIWTSNDVFTIKSLPEELIIVGGGVVGVEMATMFAALGTKVHVVELLDHILPNEDEDVAEIARRSLVRKGANVLAQHKVTAVAKTDEGYLCDIEARDGSTRQLSGDKVLLVVGRRPNIPDDLRALGLEIERGVVTNETMRTSIDGIYAVGDVRAGIMLAHVAMAEGIVAAHNIAGERRSMDYAGTPWVIFGAPEIATVGIKEREADPDAVHVFRFPLSSNGRARTMQERLGFVKVIADKNDNTVLGLTIVSPNATDMIVEGVLAVRLKLTVDQLATAIHPHPTLTETILGALEMAEGMAIHD